MHISVYTVDMSACIKRYPCHGSNKVYIIGGLVDRSHQKGRSVTAAMKMGAECVRLPVKEYLKATLPLESVGKRGGSSGGKSDVVLNVNTVIDILAGRFRKSTWA